MARKKVKIQYVDIGLGSVEDYWREIVTPAVRDCRGVPSTRSAFQAAHAVWHLHDWVWHHRNRGQDTRDNPAYKKYKKDLIKTCPALGWLRDIADAGKHQGLGRGGVGIASAERQWLSRGSDGSGSVQSPLPVYNVKLTDGTWWDVNALLQTAIDHWCSRELAALNLPSPFA